MDLFDPSLVEPINIFPQDGEANYHGEVLALTSANFYFNVLLSGIDWQYDQAIIFGKHIETKRKVAWYADQPFSYSYSNITKCALPWTKNL